MNRIASIATIAVALVGLSACNVVRQTRTVVDHVTNSQVTSNEVIVNQVTADQFQAATCAGCSPGAPDVTPIVVPPSGNVSSRSPGPPCTALGCSAGPTLPPPSSTTTVVCDEGTAQPTGMSCP